MFLNKFLAQLLNGSDLFELSRDGQNFRRRILRVRVPAAPGSVRRYAWPALPRTVSAARWPGQRRGHRISAAPRTRVGRLRGARPPQALARWSPDDDEASPGSCVMTRKW